MSLIAPIADWVVILILAAGGGALFYITGWHRPFSLTDIDISYPDKPDIVSLPVLVVVSVLAPIVAIVSVTSLSCARRKRRQSWRHFIRFTNASLSSLGLSLATALFITSALKDIVGKPRPNLLDRCAADVSQLPNFMVGGLGNSVDSEAGALVRSEICQQKDKRLLDDGFAAFPSGHSSFSCAGLIFLSMWLAMILSSPSHSLSPEQKPRNGDKAAFSTRHLWRLLITLAPATGALFICASRYADFHHAGIDIFAGAVIGSICAASSFRLYFYSNSAWKFGFTLMSHNVMDENFEHDSITRTGVRNTNIRNEADSSLEDGHYRRTDTFDSSRPIALDTLHHG
ncbi:PAP2-like protein 1 [Elsinoe fawcettii]|nr:PAP2-like protein 1 [Elsinoe fawcettii]